MDFLLTNDDGINSLGISYLKKYLANIGKVTIVAPDRERSATSHALSLNHPIRVKKISKDTYITDGTPADCVNIALSEIFKTPPDFVISGINPNPNLGDDITYSGTVAAAMEGTLFSIPSIAVSTSNGNKSQYESAAKVVLETISFVKEVGLSKDTLLNINVPNHPKGIVITKLARESTRGKIIKRVDPRGNKYLWIGNKTPIFKDTPDTDIKAFFDHLVSITPLSLDLTNHHFISILRDYHWNLNW
ncbi:5'/3'-nucleotidase SurE [bacterium]|nr:5'/3'-nucleotidase SurE [bacterium]MBU1782904.1 5'/3'-nucleotidase SurE [bacterium]